jgi:hypothetical protein
MTLHLDLGIMVDAPLDAVWTELSDLEGHTRWMADAERITVRGALRRGVGTELVCRTRIGPLHTDDLMVVTRWEPGRCIAMEHRGAVTGTGELRMLPAVGGRTRVVWDEQLAFPWWLGGALGELVARPVLARVWRRNLARLRARLESS